MNIAIDLGTTNVRAGVVGQPEIVDEPCVIARDGSGQVVIGERARLMVGRHHGKIEVTSPVERGVVRNIDAATEIMKYCIQKFTSTRLARKVSLTLSIPSGLTQVETRALEDAARLAGAREVQFLNSCVGAAIGAGLPVGNPIGCLVVSLGGGVTEAALLSLNGVVASHSMQQGGQAFNDVLVERIRKEYAFLLGSQTAEDLKRQLCSRDDQGVEVRGRDLRTGLPDSRFIPRNIVDDQLDSYAEMVVDLISHVISASPPELVGDIADQGVMVVGGGANIPALMQDLTERIDAPVVTAEEPETRVIQGLLKYSTLHRKRGFTFRKAQ